MNPTYVVIPPDDVTNCVRPLNWEGRQEVRQESEMFFDTSGKVVYDLLKVSCADLYGGL